jgi:NADPH2:quinone reductase
MSVNPTYLQMFSTVTESGELRLELKEQETPKPGPDQVLVRIEATPINPSDLGVMFGLTDMSTATSANGALTASVSDPAMKAMKARIGQALTVGNEGAGTVVATGDSEAAKSLDGKIVAIAGGGMYGQYRCVDVAACLPLLEGHTAKDGASSFVNPMTVLSMIETMRMEGHTALVHTAGASNLGQMLNRVCQADGVELVNVVRKEEQATLLKDMGAKYVINSSKLASNILTCMEGAAARTPGAYSIYGSIKHKQVYLYGGLDTTTTTLSRGYGMAWGVGGWLLPNFLAKAGMEVAGRLRGRVAKELTTSFASNYTNEISLSDALQVEAMQQYYAKHTGEKFLICPQK